MSLNAVNHRPPIDWAVASRPVSGQAVSGDLPLVAFFEGGAILAVVDGVGHGSDAAAAAKIAIDVFEQHAREPLVPLIQRCHRSLARTRGVVATVASIQTSDNSMSWLGVGNVEGRLVRANPNDAARSESVLLRNGLVGLQLPALQASGLPLLPGDLLILATDGLSPGFIDSVRPNDSPRQLADRILERYFRGTDDALVLVAKYLADHE